MNFFRFGKANVPAAGMDMGYAVIVIAGLRALTVVLVELRYQLCRATSL